MTSRGCMICGMTRERAQQCGIRILFHSPKTGHQNRIWTKVVRPHDHLVPSLIVVCSRHFYQGFPARSTNSNDYEPKTELVRKQAPMNYYEIQTQRLSRESDFSVPVLIKCETIVACDVMLGCKLCPTFCPSKRKLDLHRIEKHTAKCPECKRPLVETEQSQKSKICGACECKRRKPLHVVKYATPRGQTNNLAQKVVRETTQLMNFKCDNCKARFDTASALELHLMEFCVDKGSSPSERVPGSNLVPLMQQVGSRTLIKWSRKKMGPLADNRSSSKFGKAKLRCGNCNMTITTCCCLPQTALARPLITVHHNRDIVAEPFCTDMIAIGEMKQDEKNVISEFDTLEKVGCFGLDLLDEKQFKLENDF